MPKGDITLVDDDTCKWLFEMAESKDSDVQRESVRYLATVTSTSQVNHQKLVKVFEETPLFDAQVFRGAVVAKDDLDSRRLVPVLRKLFVSHDKETIRCATELTANLAQDSAVQPLLLPLMDALMDFLRVEVDPASMNALLFKEVRRQVARALYALSQNPACKTDMLKRDSPKVTDVIRQRLDKLQHPGTTGSMSLRDKELKMCLEKTLQNLV